MWVLIHNLSVHHHLHKSLLFFLIHTSSPSPINRPLTRVHIILIHKMSSSLYSLHSSSTSYLFILFASFWMHLPGSELIILIVFVSVIIIITTAFALRWPAGRAVLHLFPPKLLSVSQVKPSPVNKDVYHFSDYPRVFLWFRCFWSKPLFFRPDHGDQKM